MKRCQINEGADRFLLTEEQIYDMISAVNIDEEEEC